MYSGNRMVAIWGKNFLEEMYGDGGFMYHFDNENFFWKEVLENMEAITNNEEVPIVKEFVSNPVEEMHNLGVEFIFHNNSDE